MSRILMPFRQIPEWNDDEQFIITGKQLRAIYDLFKAYTPFAQSMEPIVADNLDNGKITIKYEDLQGNPLTTEDINAMLEQAAQDMIASMGKIKVEEKEGAE